jgi:hypothetical protein
MIDPSAIQYLEISGSDFAGRKFAVISNERIDTGAGILKNPVMPIPTLILGLFGTRATFYLNGVSEYDPSTGVVVENNPDPITADIYPESYTLAEASGIPEVLEGDIKVYVPGQAFGYSEVALLILQVRETGGVAERISQ